MKLQKLNFLFFSIAALISVSSCSESNQIAIASDYTITFNSNGGTAVEQMKATGSSKIVAPTNPTKNGYDFVGWYSDANFDNKFQFSYMPNKDMNLYAKWSLKSYVINYIVGEGENNEDNIEIYNVTQNNIKLYAPTYEDHYFGGWFTDSTYKKSSLVTEIKTNSAKDYTLYAKWTEEATIVDYNIFYHLNGGVNGNNPDSFNKEDANILLQPATKSGSTFVGWYSDEALSKSIITIDTSVESNYDVYAKWEDTPVVPPTPTYTITYHLDGATNGNNPVRYTEDMGTIELATPTKFSCTFQGWYADAEYTTPITSIDCSKKQNVDVYAKWMNGLVINELSFNLGIGTEYTLYHVSDTHINAGTSASDIKAENSWINGGRQDFAKSFGERYDDKYLCKSTTQNFTNIVNYINTQAPKAVCFSGDLMDYYSAANYNFIKNELARVESDAVYGLGNHEDPSTNYEGMTLLDNTYYFNVLEYEDFEIVCMDNSYKNSSGYYCFLEAQYDLLLAEVNKNKPIIIVEHVPIITSENCDSVVESRGQYYFIDENSCDKNSKKIIDLMVNSPNIKLVLSGHIHGGTVSYIAPNKPLVTCSSGLIGIINKITIS